MPCRAKHKNKKKFCNSIQSYFFPNNTRLEGYHDFFDKSILGFFQPSVFVSPRSVAVTYFAIIKLQNLIIKGKSVSADDNRRLRRATAYFQMGNAFRSQGQIDKSISAYIKALDYAPHFAEINNNLGLSYLRQGRYVKASRCFQKAIELQPSQDEYYHNLAIASRGLGRIDEAIANYEKALSLNPNACGTLYNLACIFKDKNAIDKACSLYKKIISLDKDFVDDAKYMLAILSKNQPEKAPKEYVQRLFNHYSDKYNRHLLTKLKYRLPAFIAAMLVDVYADQHSTLQGLDLGCGTGLCASILRPFCHKLVGVDLALQMLKFAEETKLYDELICDDMLSYLRSTTVQFDLAVAADTLIYVGDLDEFFQLLNKVINSGGKCLLSFEILPEANHHQYELQASGRFKHKATYVQKLLEENGFKNLKLRDCTIRIENHEPVHGQLILIEKKN